MILASDPPIEGVSIPDLGGVGVDGATLTARLASVGVPRAGGYSPWDGATGGTLLIERSGPDPEAGEGARWGVLRTLTVDGNSVEGAGGQQVMVLTSGGSVAIVEDVNPGEKIEAVFEPPMTVMPSTIAKGESQTQKLSVRIYGLGTREKPRFTGPVTHTLTYEADQRVRTPAGEFAARKIVGRFQAKLGPSTIVNVTEQWFVDRVGLVGERREERTSVMGLQIRRNVEEWALLKAEPAAPDRGF